MSAASSKKSFPNCSMRGSARSVGPVFAALTGYYVFTLNLLAASGDGARIFFLSVANSHHADLCRWLTMRIVSEEKKMRTDQLLILLPPFLPSPFVMGKASATACFFIVCLWPMHAAHMLWLFSLFAARGFCVWIACCAIGLLLVGFRFSFPSVCI